MLVLSFFDRDNRPLATCVKDFFKIDFALVKFDLYSFDIKYRSTTASSKS